MTSENFFQIELDVSTQRVVEIFTNWVPSQGGDAKI
jgi:hypothetical protein